MYFPILVRNDDDIRFIALCVQIRSLFWSVFSCIQPEKLKFKTPYLDTFHAV